MSRRSHGDGGSANDDDIPSGLISPPLPGAERPKRRDEDDDDDEKKKKSEKRSEKRSRKRSRSRSRGKDKEREREREKEKGKERDRDRDRDRERGRERERDREREAREARDKSRRRRSRERRNRSRSRRRDRRRPERSRSRRRGSGRGESRRRRSRSKSHRRSRSKSHRRSRSKSHRRSSRKNSVDKDKDKEKEKPDKGPPPPVINNTPVPGGRQIGVRGEWAEFLFPDGSKLFRNIISGQIVTGPPIGFDRQASRTSPVAILAEGLQQQRQAAAAAQAQVNAQSAAMSQQMMNDQKSTLFILHVPTIWTEQDLAQHFASFGTLTRCDLPKNADGTRKGYGFVTYSTVEEGQKAIDSMNGFPVQDSNGQKKLGVSFRSAANGLLGMPNLMGAMPMLGAPPPIVPGMSL